MNFVYDERKTAQAAAYLISRGGGSLNYMKLIKLLYLADRRSFTQTGAPITGDKWVAMKHGPVLSATLDEINWGKETKTSPWYEYISEPSNYDVTLRGKLELDELSEDDINFLDEIFDKFGNMDKWSLVELLHELPEWTDPQGSSAAIDPAEILRNEGWAQSEIGRLDQALDQVWKINRLSA